ncbi:hypothetical protein [Cohnella cellulosilytica]|uniref:Uncharacterized protein n=1 Tax=Cohnella cellulosilytica TaxID=986710 RepID=A0ABW2F4Y5_9BACL
MPRERSNAVSSKNTPFIGAKPSKKPIIGSHRTKSLIGGHRTQQVLDMQEMIGNQATQRFVPTVPKPTLGSHRIKTQIGGHRKQQLPKPQNITNVPENKPETPKSKPLPPGYVPYEDGESASDSSSFDWNIGSSSTTSPQSKPLPKGYVPFEDGSESTSDSSSFDWNIGSSSTTSPQSKPLPKGYVPFEDGSESTSDSSSFDWNIGGSSTTSPQSKPLPKGYVPFEDGSESTSGSSSFDWNIGSSSTTIPQSKPLPKGYVPFEDGSESTSGSSSFDWNIGSSSTTSSGPKPLAKGYVPFKENDNESDDDDDFDFDWDSKSSSTLPPPQLSNNKSISSAVGAVTPEQGVFPARVREDLFEDNDDDFDDDSDDDTEDANQDSLSGLIAPSLQPAAAGSRFALENNKESEFDKEMLYRGGIRGVDLDSTTFYANESQRASYARGFDKSGKMINATDGKSLDTIGALESSTVGAKADRHIFTMNALGEFHSMDAVKENSDRSKRVHDQRKQDLKDLQETPEHQASLRNMQLPSMERIHHSTFNAGDDIAGAGELQVRDGQIELVSDASGHYKPGSKQMVQTVQQLENNNVPIEQLGVEFVGKPEFQYETDYLTGKDKVDSTTGKKVRRRDIDGNFMPKMQGSRQAFTKNMQVSALELLGYADHAPDAAEERMRDAHDQKNQMLRELLRKTERHDPIAYDYRGDVQSKHGNVMKELLAKRKEVAPVPDLPQEKYFGYGSISNVPGKKLVVDENERSSRKSLPLAGDNNIRTSSDEDEVWGAPAGNTAALTEESKAKTGSSSSSYKKASISGGSDAYNNSTLLNGSDAYNNSTLLNGSDAYNNSTLLNNHMSYNKSNGYNMPKSLGYTGSKPISYKDFDEDFDD